MLEISFIGKRVHWWECFRFKNALIRFKNARAAYKRMTAISPYTTGDQKGVRTMQQARSSDQNGLNLE